MDHHFTPTPIYFKDQPIKKVNKDEMRFFFLTLRVKYIIAHYINDSLQSFIQCVIMLYSKVSVERLPVERRSHFYDVFFKSWQNAMENNVMEISLLRLQYNDDPQFNDGKIVVF